MKRNNRANVDDEGTDASVASGESGPPIKLILILLIVIAIAVFFFQNLGDAPVEFLWLEGAFPLWAVILVSFVAGAAVGRLASWQWSRARRRGRTGA
jgi:uncharacterized integral membrane protein